METYRPKAQSEMSSLQQITYHLQQLIGRLEQLQASLDLWVKAPTTLQAMPEAAPAPRRSGISGFLVGVFLVCVGAAAGMLYQYYAPLDLSSVVPASGAGSIEQAVPPPAPAESSPPSTPPAPTSESSHESESWDADMFELIEPSDDRPKSSVRVAEEVPPAVNAAPASSGDGVDAPPAPAQTSSTVEPQPQAIQPINGYLHL